MDLKTSFKLLYQEAICVGSNVAAICQGLQFITARKRFFHDIILHNHSWKMYASNCLGFSEKYNQAFYQYF